MSLVQLLPELRAGGGAQMAFDAGLLATAEHVVARSYTWAPAALSIGKFQCVQLDGSLPFDVVRRPTGGRALLHGEDFEWSFAIAFPLDTLRAESRRDVEPPYRLVSGAFRETLEELGVAANCGQRGAYQHSPWCHASTLRHDLLVNGEKVVAIAQARAGGRVLVHGSVLERRPPRYLLEGAGELLGQPWSGTGLSGADIAPPRAAVWRSFLMRLELAMQQAAMQ
jgi:lipoate-protein ligase A